jgi:hypothetical protein
LLIAPYFLRLITSSDHTRKIKHKLIEEAHKTVEIRKIKCLSH